MLEIIYLSAILAIVLTSAKHLIGIESLDFCVKAPKTSFTEYADALNTPAILRQAKEIVSAFSLVGNLGKAAKKDSSLAALLAESKAHYKTIKAKYGFDFKEASSLLWIEQTYLEICSN